MQGTHIPNGPRARRCDELSWGPVVSLPVSAPALPRLFCAPMAEQSCWGHGGCQLIT